MNVSYKWLQRYFDAQLPSVEKLEELFTVHSFEVDGIEEVNNDWIIDANVLPDRAHYLLGHRGIAKEVEALTDLKIKKHDSSEVKLSDIESPHVEIQSDLCRRYMARRINNIQVSSSLDWTKELLEHIGQRSINNIVDSGNFVMFDIGQPLHAFDADKIVGGITVRLATKGEKIIILGGEEKELSETDLVIADDEGPIAIAGVKGGQRAEVTESTKNIIIESANFDPATVRLTSNRLNLRNDSSKRYENEITPDRAAQGMEDITALIFETNPDMQVGKIIDVYPNPVQSWQVEVSIHEISAILGVDVEIEEAIDILERMDCKVSFSENMLSVTPPLERLDMKIPADIADEIGRMIGYEHINSRLTPEIDNPAQVDKIYYYGERIKNIMTEYGFSETILYTLVKKGYYQVAYPLASDKGMLRTTATGKMSDSLLVNSRNADFLALDAIKMFEIGRVFLEEGERTYLTIGVKQVKKQKGVTSESVLEKTIDMLSQEIGVNFKAHIMSGEYGAMVECDLDQLIENLPEPDGIEDLNFKHSPREMKYEPFSVYPFIVRDIAVFVPKNIYSKEVLDIMLEKAGELCVKNYIFDVYEKDDKVSYAFRLIFQSFEKTLTDEELTPIIDSIHKTLGDKGWEVR